MLIKDIFNNANIRCDDNVDAYTQLIYFNICVNTLNLECALKLPIITGNDVVREYNISDEEFVNEMFANIAATFIAYHTKKTEGYSDNENPFYREFLSQKMAFVNTYKELIKDEYKTDDFKNLKVKQGKIHRNLILRKTRLW